MDDDELTIRRLVSEPENPNEGLKPHSCRRRGSIVCVSEPENPNEGLKHRLLSLLSCRLCLVSEPENPNEGLKRV